MSLFLCVSSIILLRCQKLPSSAGGSVESRGAAEMWGEKHVRSATVLLKLLTFRQFKKNKIPLKSDVLFSSAPLLLSQPAWGHITLSDCIKSWEICEYSDLNLQFCKVCVKDYISTALRDLRMSFCYPSLLMTSHCFAL